MGLWLRYHRRDGGAVERFLHLHGNHMHLLPDKLEIIRCACGTCGGPGATSTSAAESATSSAVDHAVRCLCTRP